MRILYCSADFSPHDHRFLSALGKSGHEIFWVRLLDGTRVQEERPIPENITPIDWGKRTKMPSWFAYSRLSRKFNRMIQEFKPDIIHAGPIQPVALLPALANIHPLLSMSWGFDLLEDAERNNFMRWITHFVLTNSDWLAVDCETVKQKAIDFGFPEENISVSPWGVDLKHFSPNEKKLSREKIGFTDNFLIIHTRSWEPRYGVDIALEGFRLAHEKSPDLRLLMLGGGSQEKEVKDYVMRHDLSGSVQFSGYQLNQSLAGFFQGADAYLSASHIDGSSVALMEAMACGCPPIVSNISSNLEWVEDGKNGLVFEDFNPESLAEQLIKAAKKHRELKKFGKYARKKAEEKANWGNNFQILLDTYEKVIAAK